MWVWICTVNGVQLFMYVDVHLCKYEMDRDSGYDIGQLR